MFNRFRFCLTEGILRCQRRLCHVIRLRSPLKLEVLMIPLSYSEVFSVMCVKWTSESENFEGLKTTCCSTVAPMPARVEIPYGINLHPFCYGRFCYHWDGQDRRGGKGCCEKKKASTRFKISLLFSFFKKSQSFTLPRPWETLLDVDSPTYLGSSRYSVIKCLLLMRLTSEALFTSE